MYEKERGWREVKIHMCRKGNRVKGSKGPYVEEGVMKGSKDPYVWKGKGVKGRISFKNDEEKYGNEGSLDSLGLVTSLKIISK